MDRWVGGRMEEWVGDVLAGVAGETTRKAGCTCWMTRKWRMNNECSGEVSELLLNGSGGRCRYGM